MKLRIFTDGACSGNPGPGGWATLFALSTGNAMFSGCEERTTNNRMELMAVIVALEKVTDGSKPWRDDSTELYNEVEICSDSAYVVNAISKNWIQVWQTNNWQTSTGGQVKNSELWKQLVVLIRKAKSLGITVRFVKVKGHDGNLFNEIVDERARNESSIAKKKVEANEYVNIL